MKYDIWRIKQVVRMPDVVERYGVRVTRGMCCCPFHGDKHPSMKIYPDGYHCFACGAHGDVISWVMEMDKISFPAACERLCEIFSLQGYVDDTPPRSSFLNAYRAAERKVKELQPKSPDEEPSPEFWAAIEERNRLYYLL